MKRAPKTVASDQLIALRLDRELLRLAALIAEKYGHRGRSSVIRYCIRRTAIAEGLIKEKK